MVQIRELPFLMQRETLEKHAQRRSWGLVVPTLLPSMRPMNGLVMGVNKV